MRRIRKQVYGIRQKSNISNRESSLILFYSFLESIFRENINIKDFNLPFDKIPFSKMALLCRNTLEKLFLIFVVNPTTRTELIANNLIKNNVNINSSQKHDFTNPNEPNFSTYIRTV
jgi:hypothetical protein